MESNSPGLDLNYQVEYVSASANQLENNISSERNLLLYSRSNSLIINDKHKNHVLIGHTDRVNGQQFISKSEESELSYVISTSYDATAIIWEIDYDLGEHRILFRINIDNQVFFTRSSIKRNDGSSTHLFNSVLTTRDGSIYLCNNDRLIETSSINYYCFDSKFHTIFTEDQEPVTLLFLAGSDSQIHVFQLLEESLHHVLDLSGHEDWIKCVDIIDLTGRTSEILLASASQDKYVRIWHIKLVRSNTNSTIRTVVSKPLLGQKTGYLTSTLETVLSGHEGIVHGLSWCRHVDTEHLTLLTCSEDKTIIMWRASIAQNSKACVCPASEGVWREIHKLGETGENNLPFLGVSFVGFSSNSAPDTFFGQSLHGAIHSWKYDNNRNMWRDHLSITGHFDAVTDLSWDKNGKYLLSASLDKTTRLHAITGPHSWHEVLRPQVHGHEINCIASIDYTRFASGAEEKTIRIYGITSFTLNSLNNLLPIKPPQEIIERSDFPKHAELPPLGLSTRAAQNLSGDEDSKGEGSASAKWFGVNKLAQEADALCLNELPTEEILLQSTLWWEANKLFGHSNELHALASDARGHYLASASKANRKDLATILIWECSKFRQAATIEHHSLTITRLRFSPNDRYLLSVSRDRTWCLSERTGKPRPAFQKLVGTTKANCVHERIIWDFCWMHDSNYFLTVSRDKKAILWSMDVVRNQADLVKKGNLEESQLLESLTITPTSAKSFDFSIQAVDSTPNPISLSGKSTNYAVALGFENGTLELQVISVDADLKVSWMSIGLFTHYHHLPIRRLAFKPHIDSESEIGLLASGGEDCLVKVTRFSIEKIAH